jgi:hypothetical protein
MVMGRARPISADGVELIQVSDRTRSGCRIARVWAIIPPIE